MGLDNKTILLCNEVELPAREEPASRTDGRLAGSHMIGSEGGGWLRGWVKVRREAWRVHTGH